ncbi:MAG: hypothetical protein Q4E39_06755 [bacterium]|nr:hypothetical protein [bacterium]
MIKKIIYDISIISLVILAILTSQMFQIIYKSNFYGMFYLISVIGLLLFEMVELVLSKKYIEKMYCYNISVIFITMYFGVIYCTIYNSNSLDNIKYYKDNFLIVSILISFSIITCIFLKKYKNKRYLSK